MSKIDNRENLVGKDGRLIKVEVVGTQEEINKFLVDNLAALQHGYGYYGNTLNKNLDGTYTLSYKRGSSCD